MPNYQELCKQDCYNFISPYGLGDTLMLCGFRKAWEQQHGGKIHFIIRPSHEIVMKMYGIKNYSLASFSKEDVLQIKEKTAQKGHIYVAHPEFITTKKILLHEFSAHKYDFKELYRRFLELPEKTSFEYPISCPQISSQVLDEIKKIAPIERIVLISPEAKSIGNFPKKFWEKLVEKQHKKGYEVISNVTSPVECIRGSHYIPLSIEDAVALAHHCKKVYSIRSGFCDLIYDIDKQLNVFYDSTDTLNSYGLKRLYNISQIKEKVIKIKPEKKLPLVTIITPTFNLIKNNRVSSFNKCITSVQQQTYPNIEHIIIDGASTDGTVDLLKEYAQKRLITYVSEPDSGIYDAMNKGVKLAHGKFLYFLNTDDSLFSEKIVSQVVKTFMKTKARIVYGNIYFTSPETENIQCKDYQGECIFKYAHIKNALDMLQHGICHQAVFYHREVFEAIGLYDVSYPIYADYDFNIRAWRFSQKKIAYLDKIIANFELGGLSTNAKYENEQKKEQQAIITKYRNIELMPKVKKFYFLGALIWKIRKFNNISKYYLFGFIPVWKIKD